LRLSSFLRIQFLNDAAIGRVGRHPAITGTNVHDQTPTTVDCNREYDRLFAGITNPKRIAMAAKKHLLRKNVCHGHGVANGVLAQLMPSIADKPHLVVCHDMTDIRLNKELTYYRNKQLWRGMDDWYAKNGTRAYVNIGWALTVVDQVIPIIDFCGRNQMEFRSVDEDILINGNPEVRAKIIRSLRLPTGSRGWDFGMGYFTMILSPQPATAWRIGH
jgi:hypothetical protein